MPESLHKGEFLDDAKTVNKIINTHRVSDSENSANDIQFGVGMSQNWDPEKAGAEAAMKALSQIKCKLKFLLIFSTIHYGREKNGLEKMLHGCRLLIEDDVPSIGGTITGFVCPEGCFTRGVVVVVGGGEGMDVAGEYAGGTRNTTRLSGSHVANKIKERLNKSKKRNRLLIESMSGPIEPIVMTHDIFKYSARELPHNILRVLRNILFYIAVNYLDYGQGMEEDVLHTMSKILKEYYIIGHSTFDDLKALNNSVFFNDKTLKSSIATLGLSLNNEIAMEHRLPLISTGKKFNIRKGWRDYCIDFIDNHTATSQYIAEMGWPTDYVKTHIGDIFNKTFYYPLGFNYHEITYAFPVGFFFGETIATNRRIRGGEVEVFHTSSKKIFEMLDDYLNKLRDKKTELTLMIEAAEVPGIMGNKLYAIKQRMDNILGNSPYLIIFGAGEHSKIPNNDEIFNNFSGVMLSILKIDNPAFRYLV